MPPNRNLHLGTSQDPEISVFKTASHIPADEIDGLAAVNEAIQYKITIENTGNVDFSGVNVTDEMFKNADGRSRAVSIPNPTVIHRHPRVLYRTRRYATHKS